MDDKLHLRQVECDWARCRVRTGFGASGGADAAGLKEARARAARASEQS